MPIMIYYCVGDRQEDTSDYQFVYAFPSVEYPGLVKVCDKIYIFL